MEKKEVFLVSREEFGYNGQQKEGEGVIIGIVGGGASGMAAALAAAEDSRNQVLLFERQARLGRKLLATGNGRCNITNLYAGEGGYHGEHPEFAKSAITAFTPEETLSWFRKLGLFTVSEASGRVYPYSDQANSVVDVLRYGLEKDNICLYTGFEVTKIRRTDGGFCVENGQDSIFCERLIIACGGLAGSKLGGSMAGYKLLSKLGHHTTRLRPSLVQLKSSWSGVAGLKGVRANCKAAIYCDSKLWQESKGEIQFTEYGISGPVIFEISRDACQDSGQWSCLLDLLPDVPEDVLIAELQRRRETRLPVEELLTGILHNRLGRVLTKAAGLRVSGLVSTLTDEDIRQVAKVVKSFELALTEPLGMDAAQVTAGGVRTSEFDPNTMESLLVPGLYACGEVLDIDGDCGGFNLQWAWSSGRCAGLHAGKEKQ